MESQEIRDRDLPGPRSPVVLQTLAWVLRPPLQRLLRLSARYGDTFRLRVLGPPNSTDATSRPLVSRTIVFCSNPAVLREVFAPGRSDLRAGLAQEFTRWHVGAEAIVVLDGAAHEAERRRMGQLVRGVAAGDLAREAVARSLTAWPEGTASLHRLLRDTALDVTLSTVFGRLEAPVLAELRRLVRRGAIGTSVSPLLHVLPPLRARLGRWSPGSRLRQAVRAFDAFVTREMSARRAQARPDGSFLDLLTGTHCPGGRSISLTGERARSLIGGLENIPAATVWCATHAVTSPGLMDRIRLASDDDPLPEAVCRESLRLNPPFIGGFRYVTAPLTLGGIRFEPGSLILPNPASAHRNPTLYSDPHHFRPERFLERSFAAHEYAPFGGGDRRCVAERMALDLMRLILRSIATTFELRPVRPWSSLERQDGLLLVPRDRLPVTLRRRRS